MEECQLIRLMEIESPPLTVLVDLGRSPPSVAAKVGGWVGAWCEAGCQPSVKVSSAKYLLTTRGTMINLLTRTLEDTRLTKWSGWASLAVKLVASRASWRLVRRRAQRLFCHIPHTDAWPESGHGQSFHGPKVRDILQNERSVFFKTLKSKQGRRTNGSELKESQKTDN